MLLKVVVSTQAATGKAMVRWARIRPRAVSSKLQRRKMLATGSVTLTSRSRRQSKRLRRTP
jgi:hypothetical protein